MYANLTDLKTFLGITDTNRDTLLQSLLDTATTDVEDQLARNYSGTAKSKTKTTRTLINGDCVFADYDLVAVQSVKVGADQNTATYTIVDAEMGLVRVNPVQVPVEITYTYGLTGQTPETPEPVNQAILLRASQLASFTKEGDLRRVASLQIGALNTSYLNEGTLDAEIDRLLKPYRVVRL